MDTKITVNTHSWSKQKYHTIQRLINGGNLGKVFRMSPDHIPRVVLRWTPTGKRSKGRPKTTRGNLLYLYPNCPIWV